MEKWILVFQNHVNTVSRVMIVDGKVHPIALSRKLGLRNRPIFPKEA